MFVLIFSYFGIPLEYQRKILYIGILSAIILRAIFIFVGVTTIEAHRGVLFIFAFLLIYSAYELIKAKEISVEPEKNLVVKFARKYLPLVSFYEKDKFLIKRDGKLFFTPLWLVLLAIENTDIIFAFDSVPAVISVTENLFIAYTSNISAVLGLRSLYSCLR